MILRALLSFALATACSLPAGSQTAANASPGAGAYSPAAPATAMPAPVPPEPAPGPEPEPVEKTEPQLPDSPSYHQLTSHDKFEDFVHRTYSPYTFASVLINAGYSQAVGDWPTYGGGMEGFGKRFGATLTDTETGMLFRVWLFPTIFHQDPRYLPSGKRGIVARGWYAATRVLVGRTDEGDSTFNWPEILGTVFTAAATNAYYPRRDRGFVDTVSRSFGGVSSDASSNVLREFWPDIKRIFVKHEPERMKRLENRLPSAVFGPPPGELPPMTPPDTTPPAQVPSGTLAPASSPAPTRR